MDRKGNIYISDHANNCIRKLTPTEDGLWAVSTLSGSRQGKEGFADGDAAAARFRCPRGLALDVDDNLIVADHFNHCIRKVEVADGKATTVAGSKEGGEAARGFADGEGMASLFDEPFSVGVDGNGSILVSDRSNNRVRMIEMAGGTPYVSTLAGGAEKGSADGEGTSARFNEPEAAAIDERGRLLLAEFGSEGCLRWVEAAGLSGAPPPYLTVRHMPRGEAGLRRDYGRLLEDSELADVFFAVDGERIGGHRCVLAARSPYFEGLFKSGRSMREGGSRAVGDAIPLQEVKAGAFRVLLRFLYAGVLPEEEDSGEGLGAGELAVVADRFQAQELFEHSVGLFRRGLQVTNVVQRLVQASHIASSFRPSLLIPLYA